MNSRSVADAVREEQRLLLKTFIVFWDEVDATVPDDAAIERFLDSNGEEQRKLLSRVEAELAPAVAVLRRNRGRDVPSVAVEGITLRILNALELLKGE